MPRYFFNVYDGVDKRDPDGTELRDLATARLGGVMLAINLLREYATAIIDSENRHLEVADGSGLVLFRLEVCTTYSPAARLATPRRTVRYTKRRPSSDSCKTIADILATLAAARYDPFRRRWLGPRSLVTAEHAAE